MLAMLTGAGWLRLSGKCRCVACGRHGAASGREAYMYSIRAHGVPGQHAAARGRIPCVLVSRSARQGDRRRKAQRSSLSSRASRGGFAGGVQRPKCTCWRYVPHGKWPDMPRPRQELCMTHTRTLACVRRESASFGLSSHARTGAAWTHTHASIFNTRAL